ncbi:MAG TPA: hypothetical protein VJT84_03760 [Gaiellaceae bacterium]|nr:hypothetical protein [Gaiellaceae bacterium]
MFSRSRIVVLALLGALAVSIGFGGAALGPHSANAAATRQVDNQDVNCDDTAGMPYCTIQGAIDASDPGDTIHVAAGTYPEHVTVDKKLLLDGAGDTTIVDPTTDGPAITITAGGSSGDPLILSDLKATGVTGTGNTGSGLKIGAGVTDVTISHVTSTGNGGNGLAVDTTGALARLTLDSVDFSGNTQSGFRLPTSMAGLDGLTITDSHFDNNGFAGMEINGPPSTAAVTNVSITDSTFSGDGIKGIYAERLDHAVLDGITVNMSGTAPGTGTFTAGIDLNLKKQAFSNITIADSAITNSGTGDSANGVGMAIKSRDDGGNGPTSVDNVTVSGNTITGNQIGLRLGEPGKNNVGPTNVHVFENEISGSVGNNLVNVSQTTADASVNYWGSSDPSTVSAKISGPVDFTPLLDNGDSDTGTAGFQADLSSLTVHTLGSQVGATARIQEGIDQVASGGTVHVAAGAYAESDTIGKTLSLEGAQAGQAAGGRTFGDAAESTITGKVTIQAADVDLDGFSLTNPNVADAAFGIVVKTAGSGATITNNLFDTISSSLPSSNGVATAQAVYLENGPDDVSVTDNAIANVSSQRSAKGVYVGDTGASNPSDGVLIDGNSISDVSSVTRGAYGVQANNAAGTELEVAGNTFSGLTGGGWVHVIGLERDTPVASIHDNTISDIEDTTPTPNDAVAVWFEDDPSFSDAEVHTNNLTVDSTQFGIAVASGLSGSPLDGTCNWWGDPSGPSGAGPGSGSMVSTKVTFSPWLVAAAPGGACSGTPDQVCNGKLATITGGPGNSTVNGTNGDDVIVDRNGNNTVNGKGGNDSICTGAGVDKINSGDGDDWVDAGGGNDTVKSGDGNDTVDAGDGKNSVVSGSGDDDVTTGTGNDTVSTAGGNDTVNAGDGKNSVNGGPGDDDLTAGSGNDTINGAGNSDECHPDGGTNTVKNCEVIS